MLIIYILTSIYPFGDKTLLALDMSGQYVNFLEYFNNIILENASIFYNFSMNLGSNMYGLFAYYISSPLNLILLFFNNENITEGILVLNILKIALSSLTMSILLLNTTKNKKINIILLSLMYSLMSYNIVYSQNIMWLDGAIYLPLVILGIENILKYNKEKLYIISFVFCIISNFYVGYMVGLFSIIYTIIRMIQLKSNKTTIKTYIKATIIMLLISMIILIPVFFNLLDSKYEQNSNLFSFDLHFNLLTAISKITLGSFVLNDLAFGAPNIYCGLISLILIFVYFANKDIPLKNKITYLIFFVILILSFTICTLDYVMHMLQATVWFPFRDSFVFSFLMIIVAAKGLEKIKNISISTYIKIISAISFLLVIMSNLDIVTMTDKKVLFSILFLVVNGILLYYSNMNNKKILNLVLILLVSLELISNGILITKQIGYVTKKKFNQYYEKIDPIIDNYKSGKDEFYRIETKIKRTINDSFLYNYNGFYHYSSLSSKNNKRFLTNFGIRHSLITENSSDTTLIMQSLLGIKYYVYNNEEHLGVNKEWYEEVEPGVLKNKYALNLGYVVTDDTRKIKLTDNPIENQNSLIKVMSGIEEDVFNIKQVENCFNFNKTINEELYIEYRVINNFNSNEVRVYFDNILVKKASELNENSNNVIYVPKNVKNVRFEINTEDDLEIKIYEYNHDAFVKAYNQIKKYQLNVLENKNHYIKANINIKENSLIQTSIIFSNSWKIKVDGKVVRQEALAEDLLGFNIEKGEHTIEFIYRPKGIYIGLLSALIGIILLFFDKITCIIKRNHDKK